MSLSTQLITCISFKTSNSLNNCSLIKHVCSTQIRNNPLCDRWCSEIETAEHLIELYPGLFESNQKIEALSLVGTQKRPIGGLGAWMANERFILSYPNVLIHYVTIWITTFFHFYLNWNSVIRRGGVPLLSIIDIMMLRFTNLKISYFYRSICHVDGSMSIDIKIKWNGQYSSFRFYFIP